MKNIEIKITGSGGAESICRALEEFREILSGLADADIDLGGTVELPTLIMTYGPEEEIDPVVDRIERNFENQFTQSKYTIPAFMRVSPWTDECWGNDVCPKFYNHNLDLAVFVDADDVERREDSSYKRFTVMAIIWGDKEAREDETLVDGTLFESESEAELVAFLSTYKPQ